MTVLFMCGQHEAIVCRHNTLFVFLFIFQVWEDLNSESGVWCHSPIFRQNIWNFAFPSWNIVAFILKVSENEGSSIFFAVCWKISWLGLGGEISLSKRKSSWWIFYFPIGLTLWIIYFRISSLSLTTSLWSPRTGSFSAR